METVDIIGPLLLLGVVLGAVWLDRFSVPVILVALALGIVCGSDVLGLWHFDNAQLTNDIANAALAFILFQGGLVTKRSDFQAVALGGRRPRDLGRHPDRGRDVLRPPLRLRLVVRAVGPALGGHLVDRCGGDVFHPAAPRAAAAGRSGPPRPMSTLAAGGRARIPPRDPYRGFTCLLEGTR